MEFVGWKSWNPWHGCKKVSPGCLNCYVYRGDEKRGRDASIVSKTNSFYLPVKKSRKGEYKIPTGGYVATCFTSDFFIDEADEWRHEAWQMIFQRQDLHFLFFTKRIERFYESLPKNWGDGYNNVTVGCTMENQEKVDYRLPIYMSLPIKRRVIACEPLLDKITFPDCLDSSIAQIVAGGESGNSARLCRYDWILSIREQCINKNIPFWFKQTGYKFEKDGKVYTIPRDIQHKQARKAGINFEIAGG